MTLQQAKDQVASKYQCKDFSELLINIQMSGKFRLDNELTETLAWEEAAELYARSKWDEACEAQKIICTDVNLHGGDITGAHRPEFKI